MSKWLQRNARVFAGWLLVCLHVGVLAKWLLCCLVVAWVFLG